MTSQRSPKRHTWLLPLFANLLPLMGKDQIGKVGLTMTSGFKLGPYDAFSNADPSLTECVPVLGNPMPPIPESVEDSALPLPNMPMDEGDEAPRDTNMSNPDSPESEEHMIEDVPDVPIWDDTQEWEAHKYLKAYRLIASQLAPIPTEADIFTIAEHTGDQALAAMDEPISNLEPNCLQLTQYVRHDNIFPVTRGLDIASDDRINTAFKITAAALSTSFGRPGYEWSHVLYAKNWFCRVIIMTTAMTCSILSSQDFKHQGMILLNPFPDMLIHLPSIMRPEYYLELLCEVAGQFKGELQFKDEKIRTKPQEDMFTTWSTLQNGMINRLKGLTCEIAQKILSEWKETFLKGLKSHTVGEAVDILMACLEDKESVEQHTYLLKCTSELHVCTLEKESNWESAFCKLECDRVDMAVLAEAA